LNLHIEDKANIVRKCSKFLVNEKRKCWTVAAATITVAAKKRSQR